VDVAIIELTERVAVVPGGVNVGVVRVDANRCIMVDTGLNETNAKRALKAIRDEWGGEVGAILTTHGHADHFGGNATIVKRTRARLRTGAGRGILALPDPANGQSVRWGGPAAYDAWQILAG
jgi:glyoxylase-like metal-dependent hydrolase (beta-lactamase superfamily II)